MIYKKFGKTGIEASAVGFGGMRFDLEKTDEENSMLLDYAYEKGINFFDTAPGYCDDRSIDIFGHFCQRNKAIRDKFFISSKLMPEMVKTADETVMKVDEMLKRLHTDYIDFFYVWCIRESENFVDASRADGLIEGLERCQKQGKIRHINISSHLRGNRLNDILKKRSFDGILIGVNVLNFPFRWQAVETAYNSGAGVVAMNPLSGGTIPTHSDKFSFLAGPGETPTQAALRFCMSCPEITVALNGFTTKEHIDIACDVADNCTPFTAEDREKIKSKLDDNLNNICTACGYCDKVCPKHIPVSSFMQFYNEQMLNNKSDEEMIKDLPIAYKWGVLVDRNAEVEDCIKCRKCEEACTQHLTIIERLEKIAQWHSEAEQKQG